MKNAHPLSELVEAGWAPSELFLKRRLSRKEISGCKIGRKWFMSDEDVEAYIESRRNKPTAQQVADEQDVPRIGLTAASARRRVAS